MNQSVSVAVFITLLFTSSSMARADYTGIYEGEYGKAVVSINYEGTYHVKVELMAETVGGMRGCTYTGYSHELERQSVFQPTEEGGDKIMINFEQDQMQITTPAMECSNIGITGIYKKTSDIWTVIMKGKGEGVFCGEATGDFVHVCIMQGKDERWVSLTHFDNPKEEDNIYSIPEGTPVTFEFNVIAEYNPDKDCTQPVVALTGIRKK